MNKSSLDYQMRVADIGQVEEVASFLSSVDGEFPVPLSNRVDLHEYAAKLLENGTVLLAEQSGSVMGVAAGYTNDMKKKEAYLSVIAVAAQSRGLGAGAHLLELFEECARKNGMESVALHTAPSNHRSRSLYRTHGYREQGIDGESGQISLTKRLVWLTLDRPSILLSSAGRRTYLVNWFKEALGGKGKVHASNSDRSATSLGAADCGVVTPLIYSDEYIPFMLDYCKKEKIGAIIPLFDIDIPILAAHRAEFEEIGCLPVVAPEEFARVCSDKWETSRVLADAGIKCPSTYVGAEEFLEAVSQGEAAFPAFIKPRWGMGSIGLAEASNERELRVLCEIVERKVADSYLKYESAADDSSRGVIVQPMIRGNEYGMDVMCDLAGRYRGCVVRRKVAMRAGETDIADVVEHDDRFENLAQQLAALSHHPGNMDVDVFEVDGELMVLEMNARFGGGYPFSYAAGVDLPVALVSWLRGDECEPSSLTVERPGTYMKDMVIVPANLRTGSASQ